SREIRQCQIVMTYAELGEDAADRRTAERRLAKHSRKHPGAFRSCAAQRFPPRGRGENGLLVREPDVAFCEWKFIGDRLKKSGTPKIGECVVGLFQFGLRYRARKIEFPIERCPFQSSRGNCDCFGEIAFAIVNGRELL